jgi:hypothetical protein
MASSPSKNYLVLSEHLNGEPVNTNQNSILYSIEPTNNLKSQDFKIVNLNNNKNHKQLNAKSNSSLFHLIKV